MLKMKYKTRDKVSRIIREDHHHDEKKGEYRLIGFRAITYILSKNMRESSSIHSNDSYYI